MFSKTFEKWNVYLGWSAFLISLITYFITVEPTGSFWDAGEYIATSAKLQVGHPPGAPLLQMIGAFFAMFALEADQVARMINYVSGVSSAFTILFMFWTLTNLLRHLVGKGKEMGPSKSWAVLGAAMVGALAFTYSDSFWFNAVETEVYAMASLIMALQLYLGLRWVDDMHSPRGNRWLVLICFVIGLTFGIQFMGFLAIPSIGLLYYFKNYKKVTPLNFILANVAVVAVLMLVYKFSLTYVLKIFGWGEVFFVNSVGLPFNSGTLIVGLGFAAAFYFGLRYTRQNGYRTANTLVLSALFLFLGFSSWLMLPIRANAKVVINENDPSDARSLLAYYNREQYPGVDSPVYGAYYSDMFAPSGDDRDDKPKYEKNHKTGKYDIVNRYEGAIPGPNEKHVGLMPRMWSEQHAENYMRYFGPIDFKIKTEYLSNEELRQAVAQLKAGLANGDVEVSEYIRFLREFQDFVEVKPPSLMDNIDYLIRFQFGFMYWRYFMWNFTGKQDDVQGRYDEHGNWLSGINALDEIRLGSQDNLPSDIANNKGRNTYFFLPLLLGIIGILFQIKKDPKQFWVLLVFFLFTGLAIQFYTNPYIFQPRERDYSLVGSFYVFALWIGIGAYGLYDGFKKFLSPKLAAPVITLACLLAVPGLMAYQNWDDHDRSGRYTANSTAKAYLDSCAKDVGAILFTTADNEIFPIWSVQEAEGYRTDVRALISGYLNFDWYIDQVKSKAYNNEAIPSQLTHEQYRYGTRDYVVYRKMTEKRWHIKDFMNWIASDAPQTKFKYVLEKQGADLRAYSENTLDLVYYPTNKIRIPVDKKKVLEKGLVPKTDAHLIEDYVDIEVSENAISKSKLLMLDLLANNEWERPIYFSGGVYDDAEYIWLKDYLQLDGLCYKFVPIKTPRINKFEFGRVDAQTGYDIVKKWEWGNSGDPDVYLDPKSRRQAISFRMSLSKLTEALITDGQLDKATDTIDLAMEHMPVDRFGYYSFVEPFLEGYYKVGETEKAQTLFTQLKQVYQEYLDYFASLTLDEQYEKIEDIIANMEGYRRNLDILIENRDESLVEKETQEFNGYIDKFRYFLESSPIGSTD
ncbi:glycosyltransferase family 117 protein [Sediminicola luteus]|uniref:DUF2723 domain-containing protein n=1 Tax=Sediminicola luteus TaxID=319238 RepID=A0A2A4G2Z8_9FLAO|nr:DUF2723 domain-containing protein [Sediminicola luteus]PCE63349.1 hypothetical protein B7P33_14110 [Sediminicola luteus]